MIHMSPEPRSREGVEITRSEGAPSFKGEGERCQAHGRDKGHARGRAF